MRALLSGCTVALAVLLAGRPGPALAQRGAGPAFLRDTLPGRGPVELLLERRDSLGLSAAQVRQLEGIGRELERQNARLVRELVAIRRELRAASITHPRGLSPEQRAGFEQAAERARPLMLRLHANNQAAMQRVGALLTEPQKQWLRAWVASMPGSGPGAGGRRGGPGAAGGKRPHGRPDGSDAARGATRRRVGAGPAR